MQDEPPARPAAFCTDKAVIFVIPNRFSGEESAFCAACLYTRDKGHSLHFLCLHVEIFAAYSSLAISLGSAEA
jgi:hypothetical protein